jgi:AAA15 family ATPase/GTPase
MPEKLPLIDSIKLKNFLSFGAESVELKLKPLNILIGPNGSGKSNLIEAIGLFRSASKDLTVPIRDGGEYPNGYGKEIPKLRLLK